MTCTNDIDVAIRYFIDLSIIIQFEHLFEKVFHEYDRPYLDATWKSFDILWLCLDRENRVRYLNLARAYDAVSDLS